MIIRCPSCGSTYDISKQPQAAGRKVKCMRCSHVWKAEPVDPAAPKAPATVRPPIDSAFAAPPPPTAVSEIAVQRPSAPARATELPAAPNSGGGHSDRAADAEPPAFRASNGFNGLNGDHGGHTFDGEDTFRAPAPPPMPAARRSSDFDDAPAPTRRQSAAPTPDAGYFDDGPQPQRASRRPEPQWRDAPRETYRDEAYGQYGDDDFAPSSRAGRAGRDPGPSRGRRAAAIVGWVAYLAALGALGSYAYSGRDQVVAWLPGAAPYYEQLGLSVSRYGLAFKDVQATWGKVENGQAELTISVGVENTTGQPQKVPTVVIAFKDQNGDEIFYRAMTDALSKTLQAGKSDKFSATVKVPAQATRAIQVRFATGH